MIGQIITSPGPGTASALVVVVALVGVARGLALAIEVVATTITWARRRIVSREAGLATTNGQQPA